MILDRKGHKQHGGDSIAGRVEGQGMPSYLAIDHMEAGDVIWLLRTGYTQKNNFTSLAFLEFFCLLLSFLSQATELGDIKPKDMEERPLCASFPRAAEARLGEAGIQAPQQWTFDTSSDSSSGVGASLSSP